MEVPLKLASRQFDYYIQLFLPRVDYVPEKTFLFTFVLSSRLYICSTNLLEQLADLMLNLPIDENERNDFLNNILFVLKEWTRNFPYDFLSTEMLNLLKEICLKIADIQPEFRLQLDAMTAILAKKLASLFDHETRMFDLFMTDPMQLQVSDTLIDLCPDYRILAQQLICIELDAMRHIGLQEFIHVSVKHSKVKWHNSTQLHTLEWYMHWFNRLTRLTATEVCRRVKRKQRACVIDYFIDVASECCNLGNFNSCMAIISGLNMTQISRLKRTWEKAQNYNKFECLQHLMNPSRNFLTYRSTQKAAVIRAESATSLNEKVIVPFFSLFLKDLFFLKEANSMNETNSKDYDLPTFWSMAKMLSEFDIWKSTSCPYEMNVIVYDFLHRIPLFSDEALDFASFLCEQAETREEKIYQKKLKNS